MTDRVTQLKSRQMLLSQVEAVIRTDSWVRMGHVADAVGCSHGVAHSRIRDLSALENVPPNWFPEN